MDKKLLAIYISAGVVAVLIIVFTVVIALGMGNKPVNVCTTLLTEDMARPLLKGFCGIDEETSEYVENKEIRDAYLSLLEGTSDVVLASKIDDETIKWLRLNGVELETKVIARDGLVFINNINNPVESLTSNQIKGIYSGQYTNWIEVDGDDEEIIVYSPKSGTEEVYMMDEFMGNKAIAKPKYKLEDSSLDGLIKATTEYLDTRTKAIFYTTFHNIKNNNSKNIRVLKVNGVEATPEKINAEHYSARMDIYAVIRSDTPENSQTRRFVEYIASKEGQAIIEQCGYVNLIK